MPLTVPRPSPTPAAVGAGHLVHINTDKLSLLYGPAHSEVVRVYEQRCGQCQYARPFDGLSCGVVAYTAKTLFCEELLRGFYHDFFTQKSKTMASHWAHYCQAYEHARSGPFVSRTLFTNAIRGFQALLADHRDAAFKCPVCCHLPDRDKTVLLDGITMGYLAARRHALVTPAQQPQQDTVDDA